MRKRLLILGLLLAVTLACATTQTPPPATPAQNVETMVAATIQSWTATAPSPTPVPPTPPVNGQVVSFENVSFILPADVASNALAGKVPAVNEVDWTLENAPEHIKFQLDGYRLYDTFHDPRILIIPVQGYIEINEGASRSIANLQAILNGSAAPTAENLPHISSFNAGQLFAAQIQVIQFQGGSGVRFLSEYGQYFATANNTDLFYQFQGLTSDGKYYILAILPVSHPLLAVEENPEAYVPEGGIPFPGYENESALKNYYTDVINLFNSTAPDGFTPSLTNLDAMIQSITIAP